MVDGRHMRNGSNIGGTRRVVASYTRYEDAERAVDHLSDAGFPVDRAAIVGRGLNYVEQVTGRMDYGRAALRGLLTGAVTGLLIGWLFAVFTWFDPEIARGWLIIDGLWFGAIVGTLMGLLAHAFTGGRRDFASVGAFQADRYEVLVDESVADEAARLLAQMDEASVPRSAVPTGRQPQSQEGAQR